MTNEPQTRLNPPWKELFKIASQTWDHGSAHPHAEGATIMGVDYGTQAYFENMNVVKTEMASIGKRLKNIHGWGYKVLLPEEQITEVVTGDFRGVARKSRTMLTNLNNIPVPQLDATSKGVVDRLYVSTSHTFAQIASGYHQAMQIAGIDRKQKMLAKVSEKKQE
jgi:hypothetical protein